MLSQCPQLILFFYPGAYVLGLLTVDQRPRIFFYNLYDAACVSDAPLVYDVDNVPVRARCTRSLAGPPGSK